ncbi:MAG: type I methionyl aminopeptidase [Bdellovibrionaceae bacterium]|nr:type I methionyl aminopeptidase [Pseudobdellovibrionaceae bacterium]
MSINSVEDLENLKKIGSIVGRCLDYMAKKLEPGMTTHELDQIGKSFLNQFGARSAPQIVYDFPGTTCISLNHEAAHGIPSRFKKMKAGDLVNIDVSAELNGYFADTGGSFIIPPVTAIKKKVCDVAMSTMWKGISAAVHGGRINEIGRAMENEAHKNGLSVIMNLCSHGVGRWLHEEPDQIPGYYDKKDRRILSEGTVITVEPFVSTGAKKVIESGDGWTLINPNHFTAQYEHTIVITKDKPLIMTLPI